MIKKSGITLLILCLMYSCSHSSGEKEQTMNKTISYLALGDSYTIGEGVQEPVRWPVLLASALRDQGMDVQAPVIVAKTGWTTDELKAGIASATLQNEYGLVSLLIGVNNQYRGLNVESFRTEFGELLEQAIAFAGGHKEHVFVVSIPDWGVTPFAEGRDRSQIASEIDAFNGVVAEETVKLGIMFIDITPISREAETIPGLLAADSLHPSGEMYALWVEAIVPPLLKQLK